VVVVGCGGNSETEQGEVRAAARQFVRHLAERDYPGVCRMVTREVRANWAAFARRNPRHFSTAGCAAPSRWAMAAG
jgi:hypothetical protein